MKVEPFLPLFGPGIRKALSGNRAVYSLANGRIVSPFVAFCCVAKGVWVLFNLFKVEMLELLELFELFGLLGLVESLLLLSEDKSANSFESSGSK